MSRHQSDRESAESCLTFEARPSTPPEISKYRRSTQLEPGRRFQHHGLVDDYQKLNLEDRIYGMTDRAATIGASDLINLPKKTELQKINTVKAEKVYRQMAREPLGRIPDKQYQLPKKFTEGNQAFGIKSESSLEPAKGLIFPTDLDQQAGSDLYKRSHGSYAPGEQRLRGYNWNVDPQQTRFGRKGDTIAFNGVSTNVTMVLNGSDMGDKKGPVVNMKKVEDFRNMSDQLGQSKNLGQDSSLRPRDLIYGRPSGVKDWSAAEVMKGKYTEKEREPDNDLGKSIMPGFRNLSYQDRVFGCPSIRSDIPALDVTKRSLADSQNYGDDVPAQDLINPPAFSDLAIGPLAMSELKPKAQILQLFERIGYKLDPEVADQLFEAASGGDEYCTVNAFRDVLNHFIIANDLKK